MQNPPGTIGYFAIILPDMDEFSGAFLIDDESREAEVNMTMASAMVSGSNPYGVLAATMVEGAMTGRQDVLAVASRAYSALTKHRFFYVVGHKEPGGTRTDIRLFKATTVDGAREELNNVPEVLEIKRKIMERSAGRVNH